MIQIPRIIFRTVPKRTTPEVEGFWRRACELHPDWRHITYRDPIDPALFPMTSPLWRRCRSGAQKAGLIRLEALLRHGGIYLDSDVEVLRSLHPLLQLEGFAAFEDPGVIPDAVLGARLGHPAIDACLRLAIERLEAASGDWRTDGPWGCGPGVTTTVLPGRDDFFILAPSSFYPYHYTEKERRNEDFSILPWVYGVHHWHNSWQG